MARLSVSDLTVKYKANGNVTAVDRVSFDVSAGEILGIVGESGCGKSTLADSLIGLLDGNGWLSNGTITYKNMELSKMSEQELERQIRGQEITMVFQNSTNSLDPVYTVGQQIIETIRQHQNVSASKARSQAINKLDEVGIPSPEERIDDYPNSFSGGMRQRVVLAIALSCDPDLLIADEPTTALDVTIQAQIINLLEDINEKYDTTIILITHDLGVISEICDRVAVMYAGNIVEMSSVEEIHKNPKHPYTQDLLQSLPEVHNPKEDLSVIPGAPPDLATPPSGCKYNPRCQKICSDACKQEDIPSMYAANETQVRCYLYDKSKNSEYDGQTDIIAETEG